MCCLLLCVVCCALCVVCCLLLCDGCMGEREEKRSQRKRGVNDINLSTRRHAIKTRKKTQHTSPTQPSYRIPGAQQTSNATLAFPSDHSTKHPSTGWAWSGSEQHRATSDELILVPKHSGLPLPTTSQRRRYKLHRKLVSSPLVQIKSKAR